MWTQTSCHLIVHGSVENQVTVPLGMSFDRVTMLGVAEARLVVIAGNASDRTFSDEIFKWRLQSVNECFMEHDQ